MRTSPMLTVLQRRRAQSGRRLRRGVYLLPSLFTLGNLFCGYACIVHATRGAFEQAAMLIGFAVVLDMLDGRVARMTGTSSEFGVQFDSLADVVSFGIAPAVLAFQWGLSEFGQAGWAAGFIYVAAAAIRLARFNIQTAAQNTDKRYFVGMPSPPAAGVPAATVFAYPYGLENWHALLALPMVLVPAFLMVSTIRYRSFKTFDLGVRRSYRNLLLIALLMAAVATQPKITLVVFAYGYLVSGLIGFGWGRFVRRDTRSEPKADAVTSDQNAGADHPPSAGQGVG